MKRYQIWRQQYRQRRYLEHITDAALTTRAHDIFTNLCELSVEGKIAMPLVQAGGAYWLKKWTELLEELLLRDGSYTRRLHSGLMKGVRVPTPTAPEEPPAIRALRALQHLPTSPILVKYGKLQHLRSAYQDGTLQINPASFYADPSLNHALHDDELSFTLEAHPSTIRVEMAPIDNPEAMEALQLEDNIKVTHRAPTNYYVACFSTAYIPRAFEDFGYDAALIVTQPDLFCRQLLSAVREQLGEGWTGFALPVQYLDPLTDYQFDLNIFLAKHFRYFYQREYRFVWLPPNPIESIQHLTAKLAPLRHSAMLVDLTPYLR